MQNSAHVHGNMSTPAKPEVAHNRAAFSPREFAAAFGRHPSWAYRLLYAQKIRAVTDFGRILIPKAELDRVLGTAEPYNPDLSHSENSKEQLAAAR